MLSYAFVDAFTRVDRQEAMSRLERAVAHAEGVVVDFGFFTNEAVRLTIEIAAGAVPRLRAALEACDVHLFETCARDLDRSAAQPTSKKPVLAMLHVTFTTEAACA